MIEAGYEDLYSENTVHITDRSKGQHRFDDYLEDHGSLNERPKGAFCAGHILMNARKHAPKEEKAFHANFFWALQGSSTMDEIAHNASKLEENFPSVSEYLLNTIEPDQWIWYTQGTPSTYYYFRPIIETYGVSNTNCNICEIICLCHVYM